MDGKEKYYTCNIDGWERKVLYTRWMGKKSIIHVTLDGWERKVLYM